MVLIIILLFIQVKFGFGFRLGWSSPVGFGSQLNPSRGNSAKNETLKADLPIGSKVVFSTTPCELPILPQKPFPSKSPSSSLGTFEKEVTLKRQSLGADITSSQYEDYSCCFPNWSSPISNIMVAVSLDVSIIPPQTFLAPMMKRARLGCKEQTLIDDLRSLFTDSDMV